MLTRRIAIPCLLLLAAAWQARAAPPSQGLDYSPDITGVFSTVLLDDESVAEDNLAGTVNPLNLGQLPPQTAVTAFHRRPNGDRLFVLDVSTTLGGLFVTPRDVIGHDGTSYWLEFDGSAEGLPPGAGIDAISETGNNLLLSLDVTVSLNGLLAHDEDLVAHQGSGYSMVFDGSVAGIDTALDLDGAHLRPGQTLLLSLDGSGNVAHLRFDDEDVLEYDLVAGNFTLIYDGSAFQPAWSAADLDALSSGAPGNAAGGAGSGPGRGQGNGQ